MRFAIVINLNGANALGIPIHSARDGGGMAEIGGCHNKTSVAPSCASATAVW